MKKLCLLLLTILFISAIGFSQRIVNFEKPMPVQTEMSEASGFMILYQGETGKYLYGNFRIQRLAASNIFTLDSIYLRTGKLFDMATMQPTLPLSENTKCYSAFGQDDKVAVLSVGTSQLYLYVTSGKLDWLRHWLDGRSTYIGWLFSVQWSDGRQDTTLRIHRNQR